VALISSCEGCPHRNIPEVIKQKFNKYVQNSFDATSCEDPMIIGCIMRHRELEWDSFIEWMKDGKFITETDLVDIGYIT